MDAGNGKYNLIILCWSVGQASQVHDHSDSHCFVKILSGELTEVRYAFPPDGDLATNVDDDSDDEKIFAPTPLQKTLVKVYPTDGVTYINGRYPMKFFKLYYYYSIDDDTDIIVRIIRQMEVLA